jgi:multidrug efflux pump
VSRTNGSVSRFFIKRPIFAWVIAIIVMLLGAMAVVRLPVSLYPNIAPTTVEIDAVYPGASAKAAEDSVTQIIEQNMSGLDGLLYMASTSDQAGSVSITLTFSSDTRLDTALVEVQNKLQQATPLLPQIVQQQGISVSNGNSTNQMIVCFVSRDGRMSAADLDDYVASNVINLLSRVPNVGSVHLFGSEHAMRIWLNADKLNMYGLTPEDVAAAVRAQNAQVSVGQLGGLPSVGGQQLNATITALGRLHTPEQFSDIILRSNSDGKSLRLGDVARVELGRADYGLSVRYNGEPASGVGITLASGANALVMSQGVRSLLAGLAPRLPPGVAIVMPYDTTPYVNLSIRGVIETLVEAILLVFVVMFLFLQNLRATLIPMITVPVVLLGTFAVLDAAGLSINMLTLFAIVLAIGLLVDDAIVVVENVERIMSREGLSPLEATYRSTEQITGALVGIASVLSAVFIPMSFLHGSVGVIYRQFSITIVSAMLLSAIVAVILTPTLCATLLRPPGAESRPLLRGFFRRFNQGFNRAEHAYHSIVTRILARPLRFMVVYLVLALAAAVQFFHLPTAFLPNEDEGYLFALVQAPVGATQTRTLHALDQAEDIFLKQERNAVASVLSIVGYSFAGTGQNAAFSFVRLKDWSERKSSSQSAAALQESAGHALAGIADAQVFAFAPPPVPELGNSAGFDFYLRDDYGQGHEALTAARDKFLALAAKDARLANVRPNGQDDTPQFRLSIDPQRATSLGLSMADVNDMLSMVWGGRYIDDFVDHGRVKRVIIQGDAPFRMAPEDFSKWFVRNGNGGMVSVASFANSHWDYGSPRLERYNGAAAMEINGEAAPGVSSGEAMKEIERLVAQLPAGFSAQFTGQSYDEREAGGQTPLLYALSLALVFLWLAALYESWSIPVAILLAVPLGVVGAVFATAFRGMERDIYFQVAMLTTAGLTAKNAILVVEFAKERIQHGMEVIEASLLAARDRLRPILMTSLAFGFGVLPLVAATGAGSGAQRAIGTEVFGGMLAGTFLGILFIPLFFVVVQRFFHSLPARQASLNSPGQVDMDGISHGD